MIPPPAPQPDELLAQAGWVRALAARLADGRDDADDLVQDAFVAALSAGDVRRPASWFATVVRRLAARGRRASARRDARERAAARPEAEPGLDAGALIAKAELQARVIRAVTALDEPYRTTVLLRYFEGLSLLAIAARTGVPASTARTRLARGLERLRERFDGEYADDGGRAAWSAAFVEMAGPLLPSGAGVAAGAGILTGALAMNAWMKGAVAAAAIAVGLVGIRALGVERADPVTLTRASEERGARTELRPDGAGATDLLAAAGEPEERVEVAVQVLPAPAEATDTPAEADAAPAKAGKGPARIEARLLDERGRGIADGRLELRGTVFRAGARADGGVTLSAPVTAAQGLERAVVVASAPNRATRYLQTALSAGATTHLGALVLGPEGVLEGRVLDVAGQGVAKVRVFVGDIDQELGRPDALRLRGPLQTEPVHETRTDAEGAFRLPGCAAGPARLWAGGGGRGFAWTDPLEIAVGLNPPIELVLPPTAGHDRIAGVVLAPDGSPVPHARIGVEFRDGSSAWALSEAADARGHFEIKLQAEVPHDLAFSDPEGRWASVSWPAVPPGTEDLEIRFAVTPALRLVVVDPRGEPVERFAIVLEEARERNPYAGPARLAVLPLDERPAGAVELPAPTVAFTIEIAATGFETRRLGPYPPDAPPVDERVELAPLPGVEGRVTIDGKPVSGAEVLLARVIDDDELYVHNGYRVRYARSTDPARTGADGRFRVFPPERGTYVLRAERDGRAPAELELELEPARAVRDVELALGRGGSIEGAVLLPAGADAEGHLIALNHGDGHPLTLRAGPGGRFRVEGLAPGDWQVLEADEEILPSRVTTTRGERRGQGPIEWSCRVREGETTRFDVDLRQRAGGTLAGRLVLAVPTAGFTASLRKLESGPAGGPSAPLAQDALDAAGAFELAYPEGGAYRIELRLLEPDALLELAADLELEPGGAAWETELAFGSVIGRIGTIPAGARFEYRADGPDPRSKITIRFTPAADGAFRLPHVPAGTGAILRRVMNAESRGGDEELGRVAVSAGRVSELELP